MKKVSTSESYQLATDVCKRCCDDCASSMGRANGIFAGIIIRCIRSSTADGTSVTLLAIYIIHIMIGVLTVPQFNPKLSLILPVRLFRATRDVTTLLF